MPNAKPCQAYILSQRQEGWRAIDARYDDGGYSGGTMERPGLKRLLVDIEAKKVDTVVVYKVDRLTRSLADFAKIIEVFDARGVSFVSVTQQFNTTSSMGRLTLNVLLSFAQFEREVTGERIRDKIAASKRKGMWMGGCIPLGYDVRDRRLVVNQTEAEQVRRIFHLYLEFGCVKKLKAHLDEHGIKTKTRVSRSRNRTGGSVCTQWEHSTKSWETGPISERFPTRVSPIQENTRRSSILNFGRRYASELLEASAVSDTAEMLQLQAFCADWFMTKRGIASLRRMP